MRRLWGRSGVGKISDEPSKPRPANRATYWQIAASGSAFVGIAQQIRVVLTLTMTVLLARLLAPEQFGIIAMTAPITAFLLLLQNLGLDQAIVQSSDIKRRELSAIFWFNIGITLSLALVLACMSPFVGKFYGEARAGQYALASSLTLVLAGPTLVHMALLNRELRFASLAIIDIIQSISQFIVTLVAAYFLRNFWAIWVGAAAAAAIQLVALWTLQSWRPRRQIQIGSAKRFLGFGGGVTGFKVVNFFARNLDNLLIGRVWGAASLGYYDRAYRLMLFPLENISAPVSRVLLPILARLRPEPAKFRRAYLLTLRSLVLFTMPAVAVAGATADRLIPAMLGSGWEQAVRIFELLAMTALIQPFLNALGWLFIAMERGRALFLWGVVASFVIVAGFVIGIGGGPIGVARAYTVCNFLLLPVLVIWASRDTPISVLDLCSVLLPNFVSGVLIWIAMASWSAGSQPLVVILCVGVIAGYVLTIGANLLLSNGRDLGSVAMRGIQHLSDRRTTAKHADSTI